MARASKKCVYLSATAAFVAVYASPAYAATAETEAQANDTPVIQDIIVTARRTEESVQKVPLSVSVLNPRLLETKGTFTTSDLANSIVGLHAAPLANARDQVQFSIRGQSQQVTSIFTPVVPYFAEVPLNGIVAGTMIDLERVEVLKGPQGVRFGRVTNGGAILLTPATPKDEFAGMIEGRYGNYDLRGVQGMLNVPFADGKIALRGAFDIVRRDGFTKNLTTGRDLDDLRSEVARVSLRIKPSDNFENLTIFQYQHRNEEGPGVRLIKADDTLIAKLQVQAVPGVRAASPVGLLNTALAFLPAATQQYLARSGITALIPTPTGNAAADDLTLATNIVNAINAQIANVDALGGRATYGGNLFYGPNGGLYDRSESYVFVNKTTVNLSDSLTLKNILGYYDRRTENGGDLDGSPFTLLEVTSGNLNSQFGSRKQFSNETQLQGKLLDDRLDWTVGFYYDTQSTPGFIAANNAAALTAYQSGQQKYRTHEYAGYIFGEYRFGGALEGLKLNGGFRYTHDSISGKVAVYTVRVGLPVPQGTCEAVTANPGAGILTSTTCTSLSQSSSVATYEAGLSYELGDNALLYAKYSRGYRPGAFNATAVPELGSYDPEFLREREIGAKIDWPMPAGMALRTNIAGFIDTFTNSQQLVSIVSATTGSITAVQVNVGSATIKGIELETTFVPVRGLTIQANYSHLDAKYKKSGNVTDEFLFNPVNGPCNPLSTGGSTRPEEVFCPYGRVPFTPKHQIYLAAHYTVDLGADVGELTFGGDYSYRSSEAQIADNFRDPFSIIPGYGLWNLDASVRNIAGAPVDLTAFVTNVTNKKYYSVVTGRDYISSVAFQSGSYGLPRMYGASLRYRF